MNPSAVRRILEQVAEQEVSVDQACALLAQAPFEDLGFAKVDHHRALRQGVPEVIYGEDKTAAQIARIARSLLSGGVGLVLATRIGPELAGDPLFSSAEYLPTARLLRFGAVPEPDGVGSIVVACAGTSDLPVAEEAAATAESLGNQVVRLVDVGISGLHRLLAHQDSLRQARVIVAVAGMEGALPSVIAGLVDVPVIAVPTSVGYGTSFGGLAALLAMLNSCASGVSVVNIDNGFGAGYLASVINHLEG